MIAGKYEYLAIPYMHDDPCVKDYRAEVSDIIAAALARKGSIIYAPISSWHHIAIKHDLPGDWEFWQELNRFFIRVCKKLIVVMLDGWKESTGVNAEIKFAKELNIPIEYLDPAPYLKELEELNKEERSK